jgi:hypothetical protein
MTITDTDRLDFLRNKRFKLGGSKKEGFFIEISNGIDLKNQYYNVANSIEEAIDAAILKERESGNNG